MRKIFRVLRCNGQILESDKYLSGKIDDDLTRRIDFYYIIEFGVNNTINGLCESLLESHF